MQARAATATAAAPAAGLSFDASRFLARPEPGLADLRTQEVVGIELGARLHEGRRRDDSANLGGAGMVLVRVDRVGIADGAGEHQDVTGFDRKAFYCHGTGPPRASSSPAGRGRLWSAIMLVASALCCREHRRSRLAPAARRPSA